MLWGWTRKLKSEVLEWVYLFIGVDTNGHVGTVRKFYNPESHGRAETAKHVGPYGAGDENDNRQRMRECLGKLT